MTTENDDKPTGSPMSPADHLAEYVSDRLQGVRIDSWRAQVALFRRQTDNLHADCWPTRTKLRIVRSGIGAMEKMYLRIEQAERDGRWTPGRQRWYAMRFGVWSVFIVTLGRLLPGCWCRKEDQDAV